MDSMAVQLLLAVMAGLALGLFYFGGLWLTVKKLPCSGKPAVLLFCSFIMRLLVTLSGFYLVMDQNLLQLFLCLGGFLLMRIILTRRLGPVRYDSRVSTRSGG